MKNSSQSQFQSTGSRSALSIEGAATNEDDIGNIDEQNDDSLSSPLDLRVISVVKSCPDYTIRPGRLAAELGISVNDACAELCGLLSAVRGGHDGATFKFESIEDGSAPTMVFTFPADFERRALRNRRKEDFQKIATEVLHVAIKVIKILTAFGLILSLLILCVAAMISLIVAIVAMSREGGQGGNHRSSLMRQLRSLFFTLRQIVWCYALIGPDMEGEHPFLSEIAYDMALVSSLFCSSPGSLWFWFRASQLRRRRRRYAQGWGRMSSYSSSSPENNQLFDSQVEGVSLVHRGSWDNQISSNSSAQEAPQEYRGLLSVAVEFLFGPSPFQPGPSQSDRWKLRAMAIFHLSSKNHGAGISIEELCPYMDDPPESLEQSSTVVAGGLPIVAHFNGVPVVPKTDAKAKSGSETAGTGSSVSSSQSKARFYFPELVAEGNSVAMQYNDAMTDMGIGNNDDNAYSDWESILYAKEGSQQQATFGRRPHQHRNNTDYAPHAYLRELPYKLTNLEKKQFFYCLFLGVLNLVGVIWLRSSLEPGGTLAILVIMDGSFFTSFVKTRIMPILSFYSILFLAFPAARLLLVVLFNYFRKKRNDRRQTLSSLVDSLS